MMRKLDITAARAFSRELPRSLIYAATADIIFTINIDADDISRMLMMIFIISYSDYGSPARTIPASRIISIAASHQKMTAPLP